MKPDFNRDFLNEETMIQKVMADINKLIQAHDILEDVWRDVGGYGDKVEIATLRKIRNYFNFDDSE